MKPDRDTDRRWVIYGVKERNRRQARAIAGLCGHSLGTIVDQAIMELHHQLKSRAYDKGMSYEDVVRESFPYDLSPVS
jgi:hypothetical protein